MKRSIVILICMLSIYSGTLAQTTEPTKEQIANQRTESLSQMTLAAKEIGLDEKQTGKLKEIFQELFKSQDVIKADTALTADQRKTKLTKANETKDWKVKYVLGDKLKAYGEARKRIAAEAAAKKSE